MQKKTAKKTNTKKTTKPEEKRNIVPSDKRMLFIMLASLVIAFILGCIVSDALIGLVFVIVLFFFLLIGRFLDSTKTKKKRRKIINGLFIAFLVCLIVGIIGVAGFFTYVIMQAPAFDVNELENKESSIMYDSEGVEITRLGKELRENIQYSDLPEVLVDALVATEDSRFFQHNGFDAPRFLKASIGQLLGNEDAGGGSTLSMQVIKNSLTSRASSGWKGIVRKFTDIYLAVFKLEKNFTKEEIIEFYVNNHCLGNQACGVEQASQTYFGKSVHELNLAEASMLVGMFQAPGSYNPYTNPDKTEKRRNQVLNLMVRHGYISNEEANIARAIHVEDLIKDKEGKTLEYQGYIDTVLRELEVKYGINPYTTPVLIYTNMDRSKQKALDDIFNGVTFKWAKEDVESGVAVVDVDTGKLVAVGAGRDKTTERSFNYATQAMRQIGSTAKPLFDYAPGIEYLDWSTYQIFDDSPHSYTNGKEVNNSDRKFMGEITMRTALAQSRNIPALKAFQMVSKEVGNDKILDFVTKLGIHAEVENGYVHEAHSLGAFTTKDGTSPLQMAAAYAAFANGGYYQEPLTVNKIVYRDNGDVTTYESEKVKVMSEATAFMITDMLKTAVESGLSSGAKVSGVNLAAKTGTTNFDTATQEAHNLPGNAVNDAWIVGYDPDYAIGMWYGFDEVDSKHYNTSTEAVVQRGRLYRELVKAICKKNNQDFEVPSSVVKVAVEKGTNPPLLASSNTPTDQITYEYFKKGTEPTETSTTYQKLQTVSNLKVTYDEASQKLKISWSKLNAPDANASYGKFGYNVYYENVLLGFTTDNYLEIDANTNIDGTYKVVTTFENFTGNQSDPATYSFRHTSSGGGDNTGGSTDQYQVKLNGGDVSISLGDTYTDSANPIDFLKNGTSIASSVNLSVMTTATVTDPKGSKVGEFTGGKAATFTASIQGNYKITYRFKYSGKEYSTTRTVTVK